MFRLQSLASFAYLLRWTVHNPLASTSYIRIWTGSIAVLLFCKSNNGNRGIRSPFFFCVFLFFSPECAVYNCIALEIYKAYTFKLDIELKRKYTGFICDM
jgi:hypothetical protein